ncbi:MAG TPA: DUF5666 domain-containing protein [Terriglobia bacterium]|nr:DUF5666 domain-containing protein [Terriglobia bacterium]
MNLARAWMVGVVGTLAVILLGLIPAQSAVSRVNVAPTASPAFQGTNFTLEGRITEHTAGKLTVSTEENIIFHVRYSEKTEIKRQDGSQGSEKDLRLGVKIGVEGDLTDSGEINAQKIEIEAESAPPK